MNYVLLLSHTQDFFTVDRVEAALAELGLNPLRINTDTFPQQLHLSTAFDSRSGRVEVQLRVGQKYTVNLDEVKGIWTRRIWLPEIDRDMDEQFRKICIRESSTIFRNTLHLFQHAVWMDALPDIERADNKLLQLKTAIESGLTVPETLISNDPGRARDFYREQQGEVISKMSTPASYGMNKAAVFVHTSKVTEEDVETLDSLRYCPMIFQREIEKACELRVVYVGGRFFTGGIDASGTEGQTDWRKTAVGQTRWFRYELPEPVKQGIHRLMQRLNLSFGAIDMIKTPDDRYVFLEVNPVGEWGMLEKELDYPIARAIAQHLYTKINLINV